MQTLFDSSGLEKESLSPQRLRRRRRRRKEKISKGGDEGGEGGLKVGRGIREIQWGGWEDRIGRKKSTYCGLHTAGIKRKSW